MSTQVNGRAATASKPKGAGGAGAAAKAKKAGGAGSTATKTSSSNGAATASDISSLPELTVWSTTSKPDRATYDQEQNAIKSLLEARQAQLNKVKQRIADSTGQGPAAEKRKTLRAEQQELRTKTAGFKDDRNSALNQIKLLQEGVQKKIKDMQNSKSKTSYKSVAEIDSRIKDLDSQVESGTMRLVDEKRALSEISELKRSKKSFDTFGSQQDSIDSDKAKIDELKAKLDNPEYKGLQERYSEIQKELDEINKEMDENNASRDKIYEERNKLNEEVNQLWGRKKESAASFKEANDKYFTKMNEDRQKRIERQQTERRQYEENKRREIAEKQLEEARAPAFEREIEDCNTLMTYFSRFASGASNIPEPALSTTSAKENGGVLPKLELRKVENDIPEGAVINKKGANDDGNADDFFGGMKKGGKGKAGKGKKTVEKAENANAMPNIPFQTVAALLQFNIEVPLTRDDVPKTVDALREKKKWYDENQDRVTKERIAAAEDRIAKAERQAKASTPGSASAETADKATDNDDATADAVEDDSAAAAQDEKEVEEVTEGVEKVQVQDEKEEGEVDES